MFSLAVTVAIHCLAGQLEYQFVLDTKRIVGMSMSDELVAGRLDEDGKFHPICVISRPTYSGRFFPEAILNAGDGQPKAVYELRSGLLVPGTVRLGSEFTPTAGGKPIRFETYVYTRHATRIYNLPGEFRLVIKSAPRTAPTESRHD